MRCRSGGLVSLAMRNCRIAHNRNQIGGSIRRYRFRHTFGSPSYRRRLVRGQRHCPIGEGGRLRRSLFLRTGGRSGLQATFTMCRAGAGELKSCVAFCARDIQTLPTGKRLLRRSLRWQPAASMISRFTITAMSENQASTGLETRCICSGRRNERFFKQDGPCNRGRRGNRAGNDPDNSRAGALPSDYLTRTPMFSNSPTSLPLRATKLQPRLPISHRHDRLPLHSANCARRSAKSTCS